MEGNWKEWRRDVNGCLSPIVAWRYPMYGIETPCSWYSSFESTSKLLTSFYQAAKTLLNGTWKQIKLALDWTSKRKKTDCKWIQKESLCPDCFSVIQMLISTIYCSTNTLKKQRLKKPKFPIFECRLNLRTSQWLSLTLPIETTSWTQFSSNQSLSSTLQFF